MFALQTPPAVGVVGSINTDLVVYAPHLPRAGETVLGGDLITAGGGKGANQAVAAARLGATVRFVGRVGDDAFGRASLKRLKADDVDVSDVEITPGAASGVALIVVDAGGENLIALAPGANARVSPEDVERAWPRLRECRALLLQLEVPMPSVLRAAQMVREEGIAVVLNPAPASTLPPELLAAATVVVPNEAEASALTGIEIQPRGGAEQAARRLREAGARAVIVTLGERGAVLLDDDGLELVPAVPVRAVDTTGAGDAYCGALAFALARGDDLRAAARLAARVAAVAVTRAGAQPSLPRLDEVPAA